MNDMLMLALLTNQGLELALKKRTSKLYLDSKQRN